MQNITNADYYKKYVKYKNKYNELKSQSTNIIGGVLTETIPVKTLQEFINSALFVHDNIKTLRPHTDPEKKKINDLFTNKINEYYLAVPNLLNKYFKNVMTVFGDFDTKNLVPYNTDNVDKYLNIKKPILNPILTPNYDLNKNNLLTTEDTKLKSYLVFKGGNVIKYLTLTKYIKMYFRDSPDNLQDILNHEIRHHGANVNLFNTYSDYDFQIYIGGEKYDMNVYKIIMEHIIRKLAILRNLLNKDINEAIIIKPLTKFMKDIGMYYSIEEFLKKSKNIIEGTSPDIIDFNLDIKVSPNSVSQIVTKKQQHQPHPEDEDEHKITFYNLKENESMNILVNNTIISSINVDFDLYRLKLNFDTNDKHKKANFSSEIFDLTILRPNKSDTSREYFCKNINKYTRIITTTDEGKEFKIRIYSVLYTLKDLLKILFITNQPYNTIFLWNDKKYDKRLLRLGFLYAIYLDELKNEIIASEHIDSIDAIMSKANEQLDSSRGNTMNLGLLNTYKYLKNMYIGYTIILLCNNFKLHKNNMELKREETFNIIIKEVKIQLLLILSINTGKYINVFTNIYKDIEKIISTYKDVPVEEINIDELKQKIESDELFDFLLSIIIVYIKSIHVEINIEWCSKKYYNSEFINSTKTIDIYEFKSNNLLFMKKFYKYYLMGLDTLTYIMNDFITDEVNKYVDGFLHIPNLRTLLGGNRSMYQNKQIYFDEIIKSPSDKIIRFPSDKIIRFPSDKIIRFPSDKIIRFPSDKIDILSTHNFDLINIDNNHIEFIKLINKYISIGIDSKLYTKDTKNKYLMQFIIGEVPCNLEIKPKIISKDIYNSDDKFNQIIKEQIQVMSKIID
jgi:hypothetical protein